MSRYVGKKCGRVEGMEKATGRAKYAGDYHAENMLELALVRSTISHGTIRSIDFSNLPEDVMVFTGKDCADNVVADIFCDTPVLAEDRIRFHGEPIAIIAADTREAAKAAAAEQAFKGSVSSQTQMNIGNETFTIDVTVTKESTEEVFEETPEVDEEKD